MSAKKKFAEATLVCLTEIQNPPPKKRVRETSSVSSNSSLDCSVHKSAVELYEALEMAQTLESKEDLVLTRLVEMDKKLTQIESKVTNLENKLGMLDNRVQGLEDALSNHAKLVRK